MTSDRQIAANRRNAQRSTGPRSPEGRAISSQNARRHGVLSRNVTVAAEDYEAYCALLEALWAESEPQGEREGLLTERLANLFWRERRLMESERSFLEQRHAEASDPFGGGVPFLSLEQQLQVGRYQTMLTSQIASTTHQLRDLQLSRQEAQILEARPNSSNARDDGLPPARARTRTPRQPDE